MNAYLVEIFAEILAAQARVLGMQADNQQREACGESMAHTHEAFDSEAVHLEHLAQRARNLA